MLFNDADDNESIAVKAIAVMDCDSIKKIRRIIDCRCKMHIS